MYIIITYFIVWHNKSILEFYDKILKIIILQYIAGFVL